MAIRFDDKINQEIRRTVANFNRKISRLEADERVLYQELLPDKIYVKDLKSQFTDRRKLRSKLKQMQRFSQRGAEDIITTDGGVKMTEWSLQNIKQERAIAKRKLTLEIKRAEIRVSGQKYNILRRSNLENLRAKRELLERDILNLDRRQLNTLLKNVEKVFTREETFYQNFQKMLRDEIGLLSQDEQKKFEHIISKLKKLSPAKLIEMSRDEPHIKSIISYYIVKEFNKNGISNALDDLNDNLDYIMGEYQG